MAEPTPASHIVALFKAAGAWFGADRASRMAAALSYYTLFALIPLLFIASAIAGFVFGDPTLVEQVVERVEDLVGEVVASAVADLLGVVQATAGASLAIGVVLAVFTASTLFKHTQGVLNVVFGAPDRLDRGFLPSLRKRVIGALAALLLGILVLLPLVAVSAIGWLQALVPLDGPLLRILVNVGVPLASFVLLVAVVGFTFRTLTVVRVPRRAAWRGGFFTALVGLVAASLVGTYLSVASATGTLAALGSVAVLLFFGFLMWQVYLFGAELTKVYAGFLERGEIRLPGHRATPAEEPASGPEPMPASRALLVGLLVGLLGRRR
ncbi:MAG: YihY/virulence factor BrkB family protein [Acidimicrobiia bacterium]